MGDEWMARWMEAGEAWRRCTAAVADAVAVLEEAKRALSAAQEAERRAHQAVVDILADPAQARPT